MSTLDNYIGGKFVSAGEVSTIDVINPATDEVLAKVPLCNSNHVDQAVEEAKKAFPHWSTLTIKQRITVINKFYTLVENNNEELAKIIVQENGKNITEALADVAKGNETAEWACSLSQVAAGRVLEVSRGISCQEVRKPLGIVGAIVPFNFPAMVPMWTIPISLVMGNCVILKPSEKVPLTMQRMAQLLADAGLPEGVFQIVHGAVDVVNAICDHPEIAAVSFVGSSNVARIVSNRCNQKNKRVLALGGAKNHLIALPDCDIGMAARDIVASFAGCAGQRCMAASVLLLVDEEPEVLDELISKVVELSEKLQPGQGPGAVGPVIDHASQKRILNYINEAEASGAKILLDGRSWVESQKKGSWIGPTIILHSNKDDRALKEEIFGPVLSVYRVQTREEAIQIENNNNYGNAGCIYTESGANAEWFTSRFRAAMLGVNIGIPVPREPFSFGGLYGTESKYGTSDITGDGAMEFFSNRIKITTKWTASYSTKESLKGETLKKMKIVEDKANFDGKM